MRQSLVIALALSFGLVACGGDDGGTPGQIDARTPDGGGGTIDAPGGTIDAPMGGSNALGQICGGMGDPMCPAGNTCTTLQGLGNQTRGYCTPMCTGSMSTECATGYMGPAGGRPVCALTMMGSMTPSACAIICTAPAQCPSGLACTPVPNQNPPVSICVVPA